MAADRTAGGRRPKYLYNRVNFFPISKIYNPYVYSTRSAPIVDLSMVWTWRPYRKYATRQDYGGIG